MQRVIPDTYLSHLSRASPWDEIKDFHFFTLSAKKNLLTTRDFNHQLLDKKLISSISFSIAENLALKHLGPCIFSHCPANPMSPDVLLSHKRVDAHFSNSLQHRLLYSSFLNLSPSFRSYCQMHHSAKTPPKASGEEQGNGLRGKS